MMWIVEGAKCSSLALIFYTSVPKQEKKLIDMSHVFI